MLNQTLPDRLAEIYRHRIADPAPEFRKGDLFTFLYELIITGKSLKKGSLSQRDRSILNWMTEASCAIREELGSNSRCFFPVHSPIHG